MLLVGQGVDRTDGLGVEKRDSVCLSVSEMLFVIVWFVFDRLAMISFLFVSFLLLV